MQNNLLNEINSVKQFIGSLNIVQLLVGAGIGGFLTAIYTSKAARQKSISEMRQKWIDELRSDLSKFFGKATHREYYRRKIEYLKKKGEPTLELSEKLIANDVEKNILCNQILMRLNPFEYDHIKLESLVRIINSDDPTRYRSRYRIQCRKVLKREWDVVKFGKMGGLKKWIWDLKWEKNMSKRQGLIRKNFEDLKK